MAAWHERLDGFLGRIVYRAVGIGCGLVALACAYAAWWHIENWGSEYSLVGTILFSLAALGAASVIPYCFSRRRRFIEALDALESDVPDQYPRR